MKLVLFQRPDDHAVLPGLLTDRGVVGIADAVPLSDTPQLTMQGIIDGFEPLRPALERLARDGRPIPDARLRAPLPRPGKILACIANFWEHGAMEARPLNMFMKNPDAVIGPDDTIVLPEFDTFAPIGPCIATLDEIPDPNDVHVQFWVDGTLRHNYNTDDMEHAVPKLVEFATTIMTMNSGDVIACGTNHEGLGPLQDGEVVDFEIHGIGRMRLHVRDPLKRTWDKGVYMGPDSTNPEAVTRNRPH
jgi:2-keto-4-pentenoate hydratase/2-oxohepta-3-ene-1,7-dioic acid hydratase in catechol pathway